MLYLLYGQDTFRGKQKLVQILDFFRSKIGNLGIFRLEGDNFNLAELEELLKTQTLFGKKHLVVCDRIFESPDAKKFFQNNVEKFATSQNLFIFFEEEITGEDIGLFERYAEKIQEFKPVNKKTEEKRYNLFPLCDAFGAKNKSKAWLLFQQTLLRGVTAEEIFWKIWWQVKNLLLIKKLSEENVKDLQKESGLHPFVLKKTLSALRNFTDRELYNYSAKLVELYHNARRGKADFSIGLEKFLINS